MPVAGGGGARRGGRDSEPQRCPGHGIPEERGNEDDLLRGALARPDEGAAEEPAGASIEPEEREAAEAGPVRQWAIDDCGFVTGHVSEEDVRSSLLELAVNVETVAQQWCSKDDLNDDLNALIDRSTSFFLLYHFLWEQVERHGGDPSHAIDDGQYAFILRGLGIDAPLPVLDAMERVIVGKLGIDITTLLEALADLKLPRRRNDPRRGAGGLGSGAAATA